MQQVSDWLEILGMSEYARRFADNDIDFSILGDLTDQDLKDLGVASLGHRRKLLRAIADLNAERGPTPAKPSANAMTSAAAPTAGAAAPSPSTAPHVAGERRYLTVLFCDLVGSTGIAAKLDAEEWRDLVGSYLDAASAAVAEVGGHVAKKLGDGLLALFGFPVAQENDAERAARAALAIQRALAELNRGNADSGKPELTARIGLDTGPAVLDAAGEIYGDVANIAARVQALAEPGTVLITARVQRQVAGLFVAEERGTPTLKGVPEATALYRLIRASGGGRRSERRQLTPLVGREDEMTTLTRRWQRARQGDGQLVLIVGEPGLGKSRLIEEFHSRLADTPHTWVEWSCSQLLQNTPLHPIAEWGRLRFGSGDVPAERRLAELEISLTQVKLDAAEMVPLLAPLLDMPSPEERMQAFAPEELRRRQLAALTNWVVAGAKVQPVVLAFEDLHWADPTTLDVLRTIAERGALAPLLIIATTRPEFRPPWSMRSHHGTISLAPLDRAQVRDMVAELSARRTLPKEVVDDVAARTGGVPLFVEEVTRLLLERGDQGGIHAIPPTLQQSLMARLDRLGPAREVAQVGSVIGRGFSYGLLRDVAGLEDAPLQAALEKLADADIVLVQGLPPESDYRFKHALIQDAAYENLLKSRRQVLHRRVAEILHERFADTAAAEPELLAHHFAQAGMAEASIEWWGKAGQRSLERSAFVEAVPQFRRALDQIATLPPTRSLRREEIKLQVALITPLLHVEGYAAPETKKAAERARLLIEQAEALGEAPEDPLLLFSVLYSFWVANVTAFNGGASCQLAAEFLALAEKHGGSGPLLMGYRLMGVSLTFTGSIAEGRSNFDRMIALYDAHTHRPLATRFGQDPRVACLAIRSLALWMLGYPDAALKDVEQALSEAREVDQAAALMYALFFTNITVNWCGEHSRAKALADELVAVAGERGTLTWELQGAAKQGCILALNDKPEAVEKISAALAGWRSTGSTAYVVDWLASLAEAYAELGQFDDAWRSISEAVMHVETTGETWYEAEINCTAGKIALKLPQPDTARAQSYFERALAVARQQQAKSWELRAAMSMARLRRDQGKRQQAVELLAPVYGWFTEGFETHDLKEAKALLDEMAS